MFVAAIIIIVHKVCTARRIRDHGHQKGLLEDLFPDLLSKCPKVPYYNREFELEPFLAYGHKYLRERRVLAEAERGKLDCSSSNHLIK